MAVAKVGQRVRRSIEEMREGVEMIVDEEQGGVVTVLRK